MELSARKKQILKRVIEDYIASAEPVGSKAIAQEMGGSVSSATVTARLSYFADSLTRMFGKSELPPKEEKE